MIEVVYKEEKQEGAVTVSVPRNIRQIGFISGDCRVYIEDYVYTFLGRTASSEEKMGSKTGCAAVLTGEIRWQEGISYIFVKGAILAENMEADREHIDFSEKIWDEVHGDQEKYFSDQEVVGWFFAQPESPVMETEIFTRAHVKNFGGEKILMLYDPVEREDGIFRYECGKLVRQRGYYIYYEKNTQMQTYMIEKNPEDAGEDPEKTGDEAVRNIRKIIKAKKQEKPEKEERSEGHSPVFSYAATAALAVAVIAVGVNFYRDYKTEPVEFQPASVSKTVQSTKEEEKQGAAQTAVLTPYPSGLLKPSPAPQAQPSPIPRSSRISRPKLSPAPMMQPSPAPVRKAEEEMVSKPKEDPGVEMQKKASSEKAYESYIIRPGDTLYQISVARYGSTDAIQEICRLNGLSEQEIIYPGQIIVLP